MGCRGVGHCSWRNSSRDTMDMWPTCYLLDTITHLCLRSQSTYGMLQNVYLAGASRTAGAFNFHYVPYSKRATIEALRLGKPHNKPLDEFRDPSGGLKPEVKPGGVMGALMALEELYPKAVASLVTVFFPGTLSYEPARLKWEKEFSENVFKPQSNGPNPPPPPRNVAQIVHPSFLFSNRKV